MGLPPNVDTLKLPGLRKMSNKQYTSRRLGLPSSQIHALRSRLLQAAVESFSPAVVVVDKHPFGVAGEFQPALDTAKASGARTVLGLRDILDDPSTVLSEWLSNRVQERVAEYYDLILVYGTRSLFDPIEDYEFPPTLAERTRYCGYALNRSRTGGENPTFISDLKRSAERGPMVLGTAGGGEDGFDLLKAFVECARGAPWKGIVVAGPMMPPAKLTELQNLAAGSDVPLHTFIPNLSGVFGNVDAMVSMGGYNTLVEAMASGLPTVCVPRVFPRSEQLLRAEVFEKLGLLRMIHPAKLTAGNLRQAVNAALKSSRESLTARAHKELKLEGAARAVDYLLELASDVRRDNEGRLLKTIE
jgi:predicted glycosyltransferase